MHNNMNVNAMIGVPLLMQQTVKYIITCVVITIMSYEEGEEQKRDGDERTRLIAIYLK